MRVGFDISQIAHGGGVGTYTSELTKELVRHQEIDWVFFYSLMRKKYNGDLQNVKQFKIPPTLLEIAFNNFRFPPIENFIGEIDVYHSSDWMQPKTKAKKVTTYHDVIPLMYPEWSDPKIVKIHKKRLKLVEQEIDMVIAVSESTKKDLLRVSKIPEEKITVIYEGVNKIFKPQSQDYIEEFKRKHELPQDFILAVGGIGKRKNLERIKEASKGYNLIVLGETIKNIEFDNLPLLYASANALIYVSLYEGFGLPVLEAMACGTPVVTSNNSSLPEVGGKVVLYTNPLNIEDMIKKIKQSVEDIPWRKEAILEGFRWVEKFTWEKAALETINLYKKL